MESSLPSVDFCPGWIHHGLEWVQTGSDLLGILIISVALTITALRWAASEVNLLRAKSRHRRWSLLRDIRLALGNYILLGLEFMIISDIIHSFLKPDLESMLQLGMVVIIRTTIGYFLGKELDAVREGEVAKAADVAFACKVHDVPSTHRHDVDDSRGEALPNV